MKKENAVVWLYNIYNNNIFIALQPLKFCFIILLSKLRMNI